MTKKIYTFQEARRIARGHGFESKEEFLAYSCPGAYQLPKYPETLWQDDWKGWHDFLAIPFSNFEEARLVARELGAKSEEEYLALFREKRIDEDSSAIRLLFRPDLHFKKDWRDGRIGLGPASYKYY